MNISRRLMIAGSLSTSVALALSACGGKDSSSSDNQAWVYPSEDPKATLQVVSILSTDVDGMQKAIDAFQKDHPNITLEWETVPFADLNSVIDARVGQKNGSVDVYWADQPRIASLAARGYLEDITTQFKDRSGAWDEAVKEASSYDGKLYAAPISTSTQLLFYNKDLLDKAGVEAPSMDPEKRITWEKLAADAKSVQAATGVKWGLLLGQFDRYYQMQPLLMEMGGGTGVGKDGLTPELTDPAWIKALEWYKGIFEDGIAPRGEEELQDEFVAGNVAYIEQGTWLIDRLAGEATFNWGVAANPTFEGKKAVTPTGSWSLGISPYSDAKEAAAVFLDWMSCYEGGQYSVWRPAPELPVTEQARKTYFSKGVFESEVGKQARDIMDFELANTAIPRPSTIGYVEFEEIVNRAFADVRNGSDPKTVLESAQKELTSAWEAYK